MRPSMRTVSRTARNGTFRPGGRGRAPRGPPPPACRGRRSLERQEGKGRRPRAAARRDETAAPRRRRSIRKRQDVAQGMRPAVQTSASTPQNAAAPRARRGLTEAPAEGDAPGKPEGHDQPVPVHARALPSRFPNAAGRPRGPGPLSPAPRGPVNARGAPLSPSRCTRGRGPCSRAGEDGAAAESGAVAAVVEGPRSVFQWWKKRSETGGPCRCCGGRARVRRARRARRPAAGQQDEVLRWLLRWPHPTRSKGKSFSVKRESSSHPGHCSMAWVPQGFVCLAPALKGA